MIDMAIFTFVFLITCIYFLFKKRKVDLFSLTVVSFYIYHVNYFWGGYGQTLNHVFISEISLTSYFYVISIAVLILVFMIVSDCRHGFENSEYKKYIVCDYDVGYQAGLLSFVSLFLFLIILFLYGFDGLASIKRGGSVPFHGVFVNILLVSIGLALASKKKWLVILCFTLLALNLFATGSRAYFAVGILLMLIFYLREKAVRIVSHPKILILSGFLFILILVFKVVYVDIMLLDFSSVFQKITSVDTYLLALNFGESEVVSSHFAYFVDKGPSWLGVDYIVHRLLSIFPFLPSLYENASGVMYYRFSSIILDEYRFFGFGLASNIWAELYSLAGGGGIFIFIFLWLSTIYHLNAKFLSGSFYGIYPYLYAFSIYFAFYLHRVDLTFILGFFKFSVSLFFVVLVFRCLFFRVRRVRII